MRKSTLFAFMVSCALVFVVGTGTAAADAGPHMNLKELGGETPSQCAACHRAHTGKAPYLLKESQEALCFTCHGSGGTGSDLDVVDGVGYAGANGDRESGAEPTGALRGGGFKYAAIKTNEVNAEYEPTGNKRLIKATIPVLPLNELRGTTSSHSISEASVIAWGNGEISKESIEYGKTIKLACGSRHDPHGNGNYRILRGIPEESGAKTEVNIPDAATKVYTTENYWASWDPKQPEFQYKISEWCSTCHTRFLTPLVNGKAINGGTTSSGDAMYMYTHTSNFSKEEWEALKSAETGKAKPNCIQCHVAHGTDAKMEGYASEVTLPNGQSAAKESKLMEEAGTTPEPSFLLRLDNRGVCMTCHKNSL